MNNEDNMENITNNKIHSSEEEVSNSGRIKENSENENENSKDQKMDESFQNSQYSNSESIPQSQSPEQNEEEINAYKPYRPRFSMSDSDNQCYLWMIEKMITSEIIHSKEDRLITSEIKEKLQFFLERTNQITLYIKYTDKQELVASNSLTEIYNRGSSEYNFCFFIKKDQNEEITINNIDNLIVYDFIFGNMNKYVLEKMNERLIPYILALKWPEGIKKDLIINMHKFMISLTQTYYSDQRQIVLYIPKENLSDIEAVIKDKDLISRIESILTEWTTQIRDFVTNQETVTNREDFHVLNEIEFWELRNNNLSYISDQLQNPELHRIVDILEKVRSNSDNLRAFVNIKSSILEEKNKAQEILKFIKVLKEPCVALTRADIKDIPKILTNIMARIRVISNFCKAYDTTEKLSELIKKVSIQLMHKFSLKIQENYKNIVEQYSERLHTDIKLIKSCITDWKKIFKNYKETVKLNAEDKMKLLWNFDSKDYQNIFYDLESFEKRCQNLDDVCLCQLQFGKNKKYLQPIFGGTKRYEITKQLNDLEEKFDDQMKGLFHDKSKVLDIKVNKWQEDYRIFNKHIEDLEDMYKNTISSAFKRVNTLEEAVNYVENFYSLAKLPKIKNFIVSEIALEVINLYSREIEKMKIKNDSKNFSRLPCQNEEGGNALWSKYLSLRLEDYAKCIQRMNQIFNPKKSKEEQAYIKNKKMDELRNQIKQLESSLKSYLQGDNPSIKEEIEFLSKVNENMLEEKLKIPLIAKYENPNETSYFSLYQCNYPIVLLNLYGSNNCLSRFEEYSISPEITRKIKDYENNTKLTRELVITVVREYNNLVLSIKNPIEQSIFQEEFNHIISENIMRIQNRFWNSSGNETYLNKFRLKIDKFGAKINQFKQHTQAIQDICDLISKKSFFYLEKNNEIFEKYIFETDQKKIRESTFNFINEKAKEILNLLMKSYEFIEIFEDPEVFRGFKNYVEEIGEKGFTDAVEKALVNSITNMHKTMLGADKNSNPPVFLKVYIQLTEQKIKKDKIKNYEFNPSFGELNQCITDMINEMTRCAYNAPDIYRMFIEANENFLKKTEKKKQEFTANRPMINSINMMTASVSAKETISPEKTKDDKKNKFGNDKKFLSPAFKKKPSDKFLNVLGANLNTEVWNNSTKENPQIIVVKTIKFTKAEDEKRKFQNDLKSKNFDREFKMRLEKWENCKKINEQSTSLIEENNAGNIKAQFQSFLMDGDSKILVRNLQSCINIVNEFKVNLSMVDNEEIIPNTIHDLYFIQFDATPIKHRLIDICENIVGFNLNHITQLTKKELIRKVNDDFDEHERKFKFEPKSQDEYKELYDEWQRCNNDKEFRFKKIKAAGDVVTQVIGIHQNKLSVEELQNEVQALDKRKDIYMQMLKAADAMLTEARKNLSSQVEADDTAFRQDVEEMKRKFLEEIPDKLDCGLNEEVERTFEAEAILKNYSKKCEAFKIQEKTLHKGLKLFYSVLGKPFEENNKDLIDVEEQIKELQKIWDVKKKMNEIVNGWRKSKFYSFDLVQMEKDRSNIENELKSRCKELKNRPIYIHIKETLDNYAQVISILTLLRDDAMENLAHWEKIQSTMGIPTFDPRSTDFNFDKILELNLEDNRAIIENQVEYARGQLKVNKGIKLIKQEWKKNILEFEFKEKEQSFRLLSNFKMNRDLEAHLTNIAEFKSTQFYEDFKEKIDNLENDLNKISDIYLFLKQVLEKWNFLKNVFSKDIDDIAQQAGVENANFNNNNEKFLDIFRFFSRTIIVKDCFLQKNLEQDLKKLYQEFSSVEKELYKLLEAKRNSFERLYFLSNDDFLELLGGSEDKETINFHLCKLFSGIDRIEIENKSLKFESGSQGESRRKIQYIYDSYNEQMKLDNFVVVLTVIETWMKELEKEMISTLKKNFSSFYSKKPLELDLHKEDLDIILKDNNINGQILLILTQYYWKMRVEAELIDEKNNPNLDNIVRGLRDNLTKIVAYLDEKKDNLSQKNRVILYNYILITKHLLDTTDLLIQRAVRSIANYEWQKIQKINFVKEPTASNVVRSKRNPIEDKYIIQAEQLNDHVAYGYEYIGNKERLVITPLTEKCFLTMMTALYYFRGGALQGPAGTGKSETVKDLARNLAKYIIVFNCSNKNNYNTMATIFLGLLKTGAWCCFDEFNRIEVEVLSVVRIQLSSIYDGLRAKVKNIPFKDTHVEINKNLAVFITLNPSYQFRSELPDNLKTLFRPISVIQADKINICEIRLLAEGYSTSRTPALKLVTCFSVMEQQFSHQPHYDFSLRTIISTIMHAVSLKKSIFLNDELSILRMAITEIIKPKLTPNDVELFDSIINSVFNDSKEVDKNNYTTNRENILREDIKQEIAIKGLCGSPYLVNQTMLLMNYMKLKHGLMLLGDSLSGKSTCLKILYNLYTSKAKKNDNNFSFVHMTTIYPKSVDLDDLYGKQVVGVQGSENQYIEGLLPYNLKELCNMKKDENKWMKWLVLDGPVDSMWIESLNTLLDETKMLSLPSGYRINLKPDVKVIFEADSLKQATPATVSRVGLIYFEADKLSWFPIARCWLDKKIHDKDLYDNLAKWFDKYVFTVLAELKELRLQFIINYHENHLILSFTKLFDSFFDETKNSNSDNDAFDNYWEFLEKLFIFSFMWAVGGCLEEKGRGIVDSILRKYSTFPAHSIIYDFFVMTGDKDDWKTWEEKLLPTQYLANTPYNEIFVSTTDTFRIKTIAYNLLKNNIAPLIMGGSSTGKTSIINKIIFKIFDSKYQCISVNLSYGLSPRVFQQVIDYHFEKRNNKLIPPSNKKSIFFVDDLHLPRADDFGCQAMSEMIRQCVDLEGWHNIETKNFNNIMSMLLFGSAGIRNGRCDISSRLLSKFVPLNILGPNENTRHKIYQTVLSFFLSNFNSEEVKKVPENLSAAMLGLYNSVLETFLPTPEKCHYIFNLRDISKIFESVSKVKSKFLQKEHFVKQWLHESFRTIHDRFVTDDDKLVFREIINRQLELNLGMNLRECMSKENRDPIFVDFLVEGYEEFEFEEIKKNILQKVEANRAFEHMVFFDQAINYICIINRIINKNIGGHGLLVGLGASGRSTYTKIASELSNLKTMQPSGSKERRLKDWNEFIKSSMRVVGMYNTKISIILKETDLFTDDIIDDVHHVITSGMIPSMLSDDWETIQKESEFSNHLNISKEAFVEMFKKNCLNNIHMFINLSPLSDKLKEYTRNYPSIIDQTTIVYFTDWPESALNEVARNFLNLKLDYKTRDIKDEKKLEEFNEEKNNLTIDIAHIFSRMHFSVFNVLKKMELESRRKAYFTSSSFITLIKTFNKYLNLKQNSVVANIEKYKLGLQKIQTGRTKINTLSKDLEEKNKEEIIRYKELEKLIDKINENKKIAEDQEKDLEYERQKNERNQKFFEKNSEESKRDLLEAQKPMQEAKDLIEKKLSRQKLAEFRILSDVAPDIKNVFYALMAIFNKEANWPTVRSYLQDLKYEDLLDIENLPISERGNLPKIQSFSKDFNLPKLMAKNSTIPDLALYIQNVEKYFKAKWNAEVKNKNLQEAMSQVYQAIENLKNLENKLFEIKIYIESLEKEKRERESALEYIKDQTLKIKSKLERASFLISAFELEKVRWSESLDKNQELLKNVLGNTILASGILTYFAVFPAKYREDLLKNYWIPILNQKQIKYSEKFDFLDFISNSREIQDWLSHGLPNDYTFKENAVIIKYSINYPLIIDPQDQAYQWIKNMFHSKTDRIRQYTPQMHHYVKSIRESLDHEGVVLINNLNESLGSDLEELLRQLNKDRHNLYLLTKDPNPHFHPEVSAIVNIVNFFVNEKGLEEQLLSDIMEIEKDDTESKIRKSIDERFKILKELERCEETILQYLNNADDDFLEKDNLIKDLKSLKEASVKSSETLKVINVNVEKILFSREEYRPLAKKASKFFFVLYAMNNINNMYEFSLHSYKKLFRQSISNSPKNSSESTDERIRSIENFHLQRILQYTNQCLFENHRMLFALQLCIALTLSNEEDIKRDVEKKGMLKIMNAKESYYAKDDEEEPQNQNGVYSKLGIELFNMNEFKMLLQTSLENVDMKGYHKPSWINDDNAWKFIISLESKIVPDFKGIILSFVNNSGDWQKWYQNKEIEDLPVDWEGKCKGSKSVRKLLFVKALRPDKFTSQLRKYISINLGMEIKEEPLNLKKIILEEANNHVPLMIIHRSGIDPSESLQKIWEEELINSQNREKDNKVNEVKEKLSDTIVDKQSNEKKKKEEPKAKEEKEKKEKRFLLYTLNQDQLNLTLSEIVESSKIGGWVYLANTHLTLQALPLLEKTLDELKDIHNEFRLIISTNPHPKYPISFLQRCEKITFETTKGVGTNMARLFEDLQKEDIATSVDKFERSDQKNSILSKMIYSLAMFHSILIERKKYKSYGWTNLYDFNNSDFKICFDIIRTFMNKYSNPNDFPWKALQNLIAINYGSRFTNEKDLEILNSYSSQFFNPKVLFEKNYNYSCNSEIPYNYPDDSFYERYRNTNNSDPQYFNKNDFYLRMNFFKEESRKMNQNDPPEVFGLHFNAEISSQIQDNLILIDNIRAVSPDLTSTNTETAKEEIVLKKITQLLNSLPAPLDILKAKENLFLDKITEFDPVLHLLFQESTNYNHLLNKIKSDLNSIDSALKGNTIPDKALENLITLIYEDRVPFKWLSYYISSKSLANYIVDLNARCEFFRRWLENRWLYSYYFGYFSNPNAFITAIKQKYSLKKSIPFNRVGIEFKVSNEDDEFKAAAQNGYLMKGILIEGGVWDRKHSAIKDEHIQDLYNPMPFINFIPISLEDFSTNTIVSNSMVTQISRNFPVYYIPYRGNSYGKDSYVMDIKLNILKEEEKESAEKTDVEYLDYWVKKGTCLLLSKNN